MRRGMDPSARALGLYVLLPLVLFWVGCSVVLVRALLAVKP